MSLNLKEVDAPHGTLYLRCIVCSVPLAGRYRDTGRVAICLSCPLPEPSARVVVFLPSFETVEDALDWCATKEAATVRLYKGADGLVRGSAVVK